MPSAFVQGIQDMFNHVHQTLDLPWWATIIGCTVVSRAALTLFTPMHMRNSARLKFIQPKVEKLRKEKLHKPNDRELAARINREIDELYAKYRCSTKTTLLLATAQIPVFLGFLFALNSKALSVRYPDIAKESFLWVPDISQADPYYALPVISGLVLLASIELNPDFVGVGNKKMVVRGLVLVSTPFFTQFASVRD
jgi:YidC/Oxa1 family membrane protein insertase